MKYIILEQSGIEILAIFPNFQLHNSMIPPGAKAIAAGECSLRGAYAEGDERRFPDLTVAVSCWGESTSLGVKSRGERDENLIKRMLKKY